MKYFAVLLGLWLFFNSPVVKAQNTPPYSWQWINQQGGPASDDGGSVVVDATGNIYQVGSFGSTAQFGSISLTSVGTYAMYLTKHDVQGNLLWVKQIGDSGSSVLTTGAFGFSVALDAAGNPHIVGTTTSPTTRIGSIILTNSSLVSNAFVAKFDPQGQVLWAQLGGGIGSATGDGLAVDGTGSVYVTGQYTTAISFGSFTALNRGDSDIYVAKYSPTGAIQWLRTAGGTSADYPLGICLDMNNHVYVGGFYAGTAYMQGLTITSAGGTDAFLMQLDGALGTPNWLRSMGGRGNDEAVAVASDGTDVWVTGNFIGTATFGLTALTSAGANDQFVARYNASGVLQWVQQAGGIQNETAGSIHITPQGTAYVGGAFSGSVYIRLQNLVSVSGMDGWVIRYSPTGRAESAVNMGGAGDDFVGGVTYTNGSIIVSGSFNSLSAFGSTILNSRGNSDAFLVRLTDGTITATRTPTTLDWHVFPNPVKQRLNLQIPPNKTGTAELLDVLGRTVKQWIISSEATEVAELPRGWYQLRLTIAGEKYSRSILLE